MKENINHALYDLSFDGEWDSHLAVTIEHAVACALDGTTKLPPEIFGISGFSGRYNRIILNTIVQETKNANYLEVGSWLGSTACSAMYGNACKVVCVDNFYDNGKLGTATKENLIENLEKFKNETIEYRFIDEDYRKVDYPSLGKFNIYYYDGPHKSQDQYDGFMLGLPAMEDEFIFIADDWNWDYVRNGTLNAIKDSGVTVTSAIHAITRTVDWNNGYYIAAIKK